MPSKKKRKTENSRRWLERLEAVESPDVTYISGEFPIVMKKAKGLIIRDVDGNRYVDFTACFGVLAFGHGSAVTSHAVRRQCARLTHGMGDVHPSEPKIELLERLAQMLPYAKARSVLSLSGGEAVESALKTAMLVTGKHRFISLSGGYHGLHWGPLALTDRAHFREGFEPWLENRCTVLPFPSFDPVASCENTPITDAEFRTHHGLLPEEEVLEQLETELKKKETAALICEPLQGRGGERPLSKKFLSEAQGLLRKYNGLLIFDEIYSGLGRTGPLFAFEHSGVLPDLICLGKALGGGFPLSVCTGDVMDVWQKSTGEARHTSTFLGHPLACAVGCSVLKAFKQKLPDFQLELINIDRLFLHFVAQMNNNSLIKERAPFRLVGRGHMRGLWFHRAKTGFAARLMTELLDDGCLVLPSGATGNVLSLTPPLTAVAKDYATVLQKVMRAVEKLTQN